MKTITRLFDLIDRYNNHWNKEKAICGKSEGEWKTYSAKEYKEYADNISYALLKLGVKRNDNIATILNNSPEWNFLDMGIQQIAAIHVPIYPTISQDEYRHILNHSEVEYIFVYGEVMFNKIKDILPDCPKVKKIFSIYPIDNTVSFSEFVNEGKSNANPEKLEQIKAEIDEDDVATIIYTSGTTGNPKGVMLSHKNLISNFMGVVDTPKFAADSNVLSFLPLCHVYERMLNYLYHYKGYSIYYAENLGTIAKDAQELKPKMMSAVPRVIESVYEKIIAKGNQLKGIKRSIFFWSLKIAEKYNIVEWEVQGNIFYKTQLFFARKLVLSKWKAALGGNLEILVSGGAPIQLRLLKIFWAAEIPIYEGYGLTETSPVIAVTNTNKNGIKLGTVGPALPGVTMKIADDGEILCKGNTVMKGYYKNPEQTAEVIDKDGWFHTGDIGLIEESGQLRITDRKKEMFKNSGGKYIAPQMVENKMKESNFISNACVVGDGQKYAAALIVPNFDHLVSWMKIKKINLSDKNEIIADERIIKRIRAEIDKLNTKLGEAEKVKKFKLIAEEWTPDTGILSPTLKLKRRIINEKYKEEIEKLF